jgi:hypothetical protein
MSAVRPPFDVALPAITDEILEAYGGGFTFIKQNERDWTQEAVDFAAEIVRPAVQRRIRELEAALQLIGNELSLHADQGPAGEAFRALLNPTFAALTAPPPP